MEKIIGLIDAPFTPMKPNGDVNLEPIPAYAAMLAKNGLKGVFINGSSGEGYMLTTGERKALAEAWVKAVPAGFKVIVHVGSCCLRESVELARHASAIGAWGIGAMAPPFPKIGRIEELVKYCETIAAAAPQLPFYFYHIPAFNGAFLSMYDFLKLVDENYFDKSQFNNITLLQVENRGSLSSFDINKTVMIPSELSQNEFEEGTVALNTSALNNSCTTQWFVMLMPDVFSDGASTAIGIVTDGMDVVHNINTGDEIISIKRKK